MPNSDDEKTRETTSRRSTTRPRRFREWAYVKHLTMAREIEAEHCEGGTVSGKIETDRPPALPLSYIGVL
jgi:hypothetical protein